MTFAIQLKPFVIAQKLVLLLSLVDLFLASQQFLFSSFVVDSPVELVHELFDFFG